MRQWPGEHHAMLFVTGTTLSAVTGVPGLIIAICCHTNAAATGTLLALCVTAIAAAAATMYRARQETRRKEVEWHGPNVLADALAACISDAHHCGRCNQGDHAAADGDRAGTSARAFLADYGTSILDVLKDPAQARPTTRR